MKKKSFTFLILTVAVMLSVLVSGCASDSSATAAPDSAALNVINMIDAIPEMAEDGSNAGREV